MRMLGAALAAAMCVVGAGGALAASADVRCVQEGLQAGGYDPAGIDGILGPGTQAASEAYLAANSGAGLPELSSSTAAAWCEAFGGRKQTGGSVTFAVTIDGSDDLPYKFYLLGTDNTAYRTEAGQTGKTVRFPATREEADMTTGYCVVLPVAAPMKFKDNQGNRPKGQCVALKGERLPNGAVVTYNETVYP